MLKDLDGETIFIKCENGEELISGFPVQQKIIINNLSVGELIVHPDLQMDYIDIDELLKQLSPVINIAIHDALILNAVTDYKNNLEQKVADRTFELQKAKDDLAKTNKLLNEAHKTQNRLFTNISHEFRTPLTRLILGPNSLLKDPKMRKQKLKLILFIEMQRNDAKFYELLDISRIEAGEMKVKACSFDLVTIVKENLLYFYSLAERKNITLKFNPTESKILVFLDKNKVDKIFGNILSNAFKFTPEGGQIEVSIKPHFNRLYKKCHSGLYLESQSIQLTNTPDS